MGLGGASHGGVVWLCDHFTLSDSLGSAAAPIQTFSFGQITDCLLSAPSRLTQEVSSVKRVFSFIR